jgi:hypothetical protein
MTFCQTGEIEVIDGDAFAVMARQALGLDDRFCGHGRNPTVSGSLSRMIWIMGCQIS